MIWGTTSFLGSYAHRVDPQGRVAMPNRFREAFKPGLVLAKGYETCIVAFTQTGWEAFSQRIAALSINQTRARRLRRMTFGGAFHLEPDRQGRVLLPGSLRGYAGITDQVIVVGTGDYVEIWDAERWENEVVAVEESAWQMAESAEEDR